MLVLLVSVLTALTSRSNHRASASGLPGLISQWSAEANANDSVGGNNGSLQNGVSFAPGVAGQAFSFDGVDDFAQAPDTGLPMGSAPRTLEFWMKPVPQVGNRVVFIYGDFAPNNAFYVLVAGNLEAVACIGQWGGGDVGGSTNVADGAWHHIAMTYDGGNSVKLYVDGLLEVSTTKTYATTSTGNATLGSSTGTREYYHGLLDEVRVYNRELTAAEVESIAASPFGYKTTTALNSSLNPSQPGQPVTFTATVTSYHGTPSDGSVEFFEEFPDGDKSLGAQSLIGGTASCTTSVLTSNAHLIRAAYIPAGTTIRASISPDFFQTVWDRSKSPVATIGISGSAIAVNPATNRIYVSNDMSQLVVIDGNTNSILATIPVRGVRSIAINPNTNRIYVVSTDFDEGPGLKVIDGNTNQVTAQFELDAFPFFSAQPDVAINPETNRVYLTYTTYAIDRSINQVILGTAMVVIDGSNNQVIDVRQPVSSSGDMEANYGLAVNPTNNQIYLLGNPGLTIYDGTTYQRIATVEPSRASRWIGGYQFFGMAVNTANSRVYLNVWNYLFAADTSSDSLSLISTTLSDYDSSCPVPVAVNPIANRVYKMGGNDDDRFFVFNTALLQVIDSTSNTVISTYPISGMSGASSCFSMAINPNTNRIYVLKDGVIYVLDPGRAELSVGSNITVQADAAMLTFSNVTSAGATTVTPDQTVAANFSLSNNLGSYEISTTAQFKGPVTIGFPVVGINDFATFNNLQVIHIVNGVPVNATSSRDFANRIVYATVTSFSPFIIVKGATDQLNDLISMVRGFNLQRGIENSLDSKLQNAQDALTAARSGNRSTACNSMASFINEAQAQSGKALTVAQANQLLTATRQIRATLGCR